MDERIQEIVNAAINEFKNIADEELVGQIRDHSHDGQNSRQVNAFDLFGDTPSQINATPATIATTGNTDIYVIAPISGALDSIDFSGVDALAASDTNYITFSVTNLGRDGSGSTAMLLAADENTTKATGGSAISANTVRELTLSNSKGNTDVVAGDRLLIRAAVTNTLDNTITFPNYMLRFK